MPYPDFSTGEILTSADMDRVGLWRIATGTLSSTATNFSSVFTSSFRNYRVVIDQVSFSGAADLYWQVLTGTTPVTTATYNWAYNGYRSDATGADSGAAAQVAAYTGITNGAGVPNVKIASVTLDVMNPNVAERTLALCQSCSYTTWFRALSGISSHDNTVAYDGIRFLTNSAVTMTGNVVIYGYNKG